MNYLKINIEKPAEFVSGGLFVSDVPWTHSRRIVDSFEIIIGISGCLYISQGQAEYEVKPGDVLLILPGQMHQGYRMCESGISFYWFHFTADREYALLDEHQLSEELSKLNKPDSAKMFSEAYIPLFYAPSRVERVNILFQQLQHVVNSNYYTRQAAHYIATSLLIELSEQMIKDYYNSSKLPQGDKIISEMIEWIRVHMREDISVSDVAEKFTYNKDYLSRFFKKRTGFHLQEYIHLMKMSKAKELLTRSSQSIKDVAEFVGFRDEKYFMRLFKKYENMTPTEYRQAFYKIHMNNH
ncbi:AraC family transcriptional regulator [Paenibacillus doosanensis]|uniref:Arabinose operon regulatory protein n=1 Tax=Paenibacillus konkukensis TaxID=2020716 RepID=A0ABY4S109_9BACL|nr:MULTISPECIES: AraC family transcriptional regulator [Paenibacillus]MCS7464900.1 AraC family transcriptional regulator [Paenibacillus doosanensis]UQZ87530.1 Arabinose operon regulatory protein [Paenibacillus konkukensis]